MLNAQYPMMKFGAESLQYSLLDVHYSKFKFSLQQLQIRLRVLIHFEIKCCLRLVDALNF